MVRRFFSSVSIKIIVLFILITVFVSTVAAVGTSYSMYLLKKQAVEANRYNIELAVNQIDSELNHIDSYLYTTMAKNVDMEIVNDPQRKNSASYGLAVSALISAMTSQLLTLDYGEALFIYSGENDEMLLRTKMSGYDERKAMETYIREGVYTGRKVPWKVVTIGEKHYLARIMSYDKTILGALISTEDLKSKLLILDNYETKHVDIVNAGDIPVSDKEIMVSALSAAGDYMIYGSVLESEVYQKLPMLNKILFGISLGCFLAIPLIVLLLRGWLYKPLTKIRNAMEKIQNGDMEYRIEEEHTSYEFARINDTFNRMTAQIKDLTIENYEKMLEKQRADFQILQLKINPHFLLNSFNIMYSLAQLKDFRAVQELCSYLSSYFRYIFQEDGEYVALEKEMNFVRDYLNISAMRFPDCFIADFDVEEGLKDFPILPLLVQNFVENCIKYAIVMGDCIDIHIIARTVGENVEIQINDNGKGMQPMMVDAIIAGEAVVTEKGKRTGILNCKKRLKSFYGEKAEILLKSTLNQGTQVTIIIPKAAAGAAGGLDGALSVDAAKG